MSNDLVVYEKNNAVAINHVESEIVLHEALAEPELINSSLTIENESLFEPCLESPLNTSIMLSEPIENEPALFEDTFCLSESLQTNLEEINLEAVLQTQLEKLELEIPEENPYFGLLKDLTETNFKARDLIIKAEKTKEVIYKCSLCNTEVEKETTSCFNCRAEFEGLVDWKDYDCI